MFKKKRFDNVTDARTHYESVTKKEDASLALRMQNLLTAEGRAANRRTADENIIYSDEFLMGKEEFQARVVAHFDRVAPYELRKVWEAESDNVESLGGTIARYRRFMVALGGQFDRGDINSEDLVSIYTIQMAAYRSNVADRIAQATRKKHELAMKAAIKKDLAQYERVLGRAYGDMNPRTRPERTPTPTVEACDKIIANALKELVLYREGATFFDERE